MMKDYADGSGKVVMGLVFVFMYLEIDRPNSFDLFMLLCHKG